MFLYDGDGNRVAKTVGGVTTKFLVDTNNPTGYAQVVEEFVGSNVQRVYEHGHSLISQTQLISGNWLTSFYGYDGHGSVRVLTDAAGSVTDTYTYDAFGNLIASTGTTPNIYLYAGEQFGADLGFYYLRARYMNSSSGRFWTMDSFEGTGFDPVSLHKYVYANASPMVNHDPSGAFAVSVAEATQLTAMINFIVNIAIFVIAQTIIRELKNPNAMRIQLQEGLNQSTDGPVRTNSPDVGVTVSQMRGALDELDLRVFTLREFDWFPRNALRDWFYEAKSIMYQKLGTYPPGGIDGLLKGFIRDRRLTVVHRGKEYRLDIDNLRGHNLRQ